MAVSRKARPNQGRVWANARRRAVKTGQCPAYRSTFVPQTIRHDRRGWVSRAIILRSSCSVTG